MCGGPLYIYIKNDCKASSICNIVVLDLVSIASEDLLIDIYKKALRLSHHATQCQLTSPSAKVHCSSSTRLDSESLMEKFETRARTLELEKMIVEDEAPKQAVGSSGGEDGGFEMPAQCDEHNDVLDVYHNA